MNNFEDGISGGVLTVEGAPAVGTRPLLWVLSSRAWQYTRFLVVVGCLCEVAWERPSCFLWLPNAAAASARVFKGRRAPGHLVGGVSAERFLFFLPGEAFFTPTGKLLSASGQGKSLRLHYDVFGSRRGTSPLNLQSGLFWCSATVARVRRSKAFLKS